jgi:hypothetical protein
MIQNAWVVRPQLNAKLAYTSFNTPSQRRRLGAIPGIGIRICIVHDGNGTRQKIHCRTTTQSKGSGLSQDRIEVFVKHSGQRKQPSPSSNISLKNRLAQSVSYKFGPLLTCASLSITRLAGPPLGAFIPSHFYARQGSPLTSTYETQDAGLFYRFLSLLSTLCSGCSARCPSRCRLLS